ncbi:MAG TPA: PEP-CTERM sorting domain-containing protein [Pseudomonadales bacterium]|nr:PEP-CTERM sorting domain-containing protein [Pseudomonadales bacterium]
MKNPFKSFAIGLLTAAGLAASMASGHAQNATATISNTGMNGSLYIYTITLHNTGTTTLDSFWYAWTLGGNNLSAPASNAGSALGWVDTGLTGSTSISWEGNGSDSLAQGASTTFTFDSSENPTTITTAPSGESVAYVSATGPNTFGQNSPGSASPVFSPTLVTAPEPSTWSLIIVGLGALLFRATPALRPLLGSGRK